MRNIHDATARLASARQSLEDDARTQHLRTNMGILEKFFPAKTVITSATMHAEIDRSEAEIARLHAEIGPKLAAIATMNDTEHVKAEADIAATKRPIARLDARIAHLQSALPTVIAAEEAAQRAGRRMSLVWTRPLSWRKLCGKSSRRGLRTPQL
jgi:hypothetical protein